MALVRCTCVVAWTQPSSEMAARPALDVQVLDPDCGYVVHRAAADILDPTG